jgi:hypothetical protein
VWMPQSQPEFPVSYVVIFYEFSEVRWGVIVRFIDVGGIVSFHSLYFLFIIIYADIWPKKVFSMLLWRHY